MCLTAARPRDKKRPSRERLPVVGRFGLDFSPEKHRAGPDATFHERQAAHAMHMRKEAAGKMRKKRVPYRGRKNRSTLFSINGVHVRIGTSEYHTDTPSGSKTPRNA